MKKTFLILGISSGIFFTDQIIKHILVSKDVFWFSPLSWLSVFPSINKGIAFSIPFPRITLIILSILLIAAIAKWWLKNLTNQYSTVAFSLFIGGSLSNLFDRIFRGGVIDYLTIANGTINLADIGITIGILFLIFSTRRTFAKEH